MRLRPPVAPRLPDPDSSYSVGFLGALLGVLRQYFAQVSAVLQTLVGTRGGQYMNVPYGTFRSSLSQPSLVANTAYVITYNNTAISNGVSVVSGSRLTVAQSGVYSVRSRMQFTNNSTAIQRASVWARVNGVDVSNSRNEFSIIEQHGGAPGAACRFVAVSLELQAGDYVEWVWSTDSTQVALTATGPLTSPTRPSAPSIGTTVHLVSSLIDP